MAYPSPSNFFSKAPGSAWWLIKANDSGGAFGRYDTTGFAFAHQVQNALKTKVRGTVQAWDGPTTPSRDIVVDGKFGPKTMRAIWAVMTPEVRAAIQADPANKGRTIADDDRERSITRATMVSALWALWALNGSPLKNDQLYLSEIPDLVPLPYSSLSEKPVAAADQTRIAMVPMGANPPPEFSSTYGVVSFEPLSMGSSSRASPPPRTASIPTGIRTPAQTTPTTRATEITTTDSDEGMQPAETVVAPVKSPPKGSIVPAVVIGVVALVGVATVGYLLLRKKEE